MPFFYSQEGVNILFPYMKFYILILHFVIEGTVSQNFDLGPSFHFMDFIENDFTKKS